MQKTLYNASSSPRCYFSSAEGYSNVLEPDVTVVRTGQREVPWTLWTNQHLRPELPVLIAKVSPKISPTPIDDQPDGAQFVLLSHLCTY